MLLPALVQDRRCWATSRLVRKLFAQCCCCVVNWDHNFTWGEPVYADDNLGALLPVLVPAKVSLLHDAVSYELMGRRVLTFAIAERAQGGRYSCCRNQCCPRCP